jgi:hypothetical protein
LVAEGLLPELPLALQTKGIESHLRKYREPTKFQRYGLPVPLTTPEKQKSRQQYKSRKR